MVEELHAIGRRREDEPGHPISDPGRLPDDIQPGPPTHSPGGDVPHTEPPAWAPKRDPNTPFTE